MTRAGGAADAAIVNYYSRGDTLGGHKDDIENDLTQPLVTFSVGCGAIFLLGGRHSPWLVFGHHSCDQGKRVGQLRLACWLNDSLVLATSVHIYGDDLSALHHNIGCQLAQVVTRDPCFVMQARLLADGASSREGSGPFPTGRNVEASDITVTAITTGGPGQTKDVDPIPIIVRSGDAFVLMRDARTCYHGVPRVLDDLRPGNTLHPSQFPAGLATVAEHLQSRRVNVSMRLAG